MTVQAVFQDGVFKPLGLVDLPEATTVNLEFDAVAVEAHRTKPFDISKYVGKIKLGEDPLEFQRRIRAEWD